MRISDWSSDVCSSDLFGIRNLTHIDKALAEAHRVLRIGGRFLCLEFSTSTWPGFKEIYDRYSHDVVPRIGKVVARDEDSYRYLVESIRRFPDIPTLKRMIERAGLAQVRAEENTSEIQSLKRSPHDVFCQKKN